MKFEEGIKFTVRGDVHYLISLSFNSGVVLNQLGTTTTAGVSTTTHDLVMDLTTNLVNGGAGLAGALVNVLGHQALGSRNMTDFFTFGTGNPTVGDGVELAHDFTPVETMIRHPAVKGDFEEVGQLMDDGIAEGFRIEVGLIEDVRREFHLIHPASRDADVFNPSVTPTTSHPSRSTVGNTGNFNVEFFFDEGSDFSNDFLSGGDNLSGHRSFSVVWVDMSIIYSSLEM